MRDVVFISHANPDDNEFTLWLALQLAREGYNVWCDLTGFLGGEDTWRDIDKLIRNSTVKFLYVLSRNSNDRIGVLKELQVAENVVRDHGFVDFTIPIHIDDLPHREFNIQLARLNAICFEDGWAKGLKKLLQKLSRCNTPKNSQITPDAVTSWWREHFSADEGVTTESESYVSNWFPILNLPTHIFFHVLQRVTIGRLGLSFEPPHPAISEGEFVISFAPAEDITEYLEEGVIISRTLSFAIGEFLLGECDNQPVDRAEAGKLVRRLLKLAWQNSKTTMQLPLYDLSNAQCGYFTKGFASEDKVFFDGVDSNRTWRQLVGYATVTKGKRFWHFAIQSKPVTHPFIGFCIKPHVLFSDDGKTIWDQPKRMHRARRSQCKNWYNPEWRDRLLAAMSWLADSTEGIQLRLSADSSAAVSKLPLGFESPVSYREPGQYAPRDDDHIEDDDEEDEDESTEDNE